VGKFDHLTDEQLTHKRARLNPWVADYVEFDLELKRRDEERQDNRHKEVSYRSWLSIFIALGSLVVAIASLWVALYALGWFH
jgi:hypothetical protein